MIKNITLILTVSLFCATLSFAQGSPDQALKDRDQVIKNVIGPDKEVSPTEREKLKVVINDVIDFNSLSQTALGKYWNQISQEDRSDFKHVFSEVVKKSSVKKLNIYKADKIDYKNVSVNGTDAVVTVQVKYQREITNINYKMHVVNGKWLVYDTVIDNLSTALNYRDQFYKEIEQTSFYDLLDKLEDKLNEPD